MKGAREKIAKVLEKKRFISFAYFFGSRAKGLNNERSDYDIAIYLYNNQRKLPGWTVFQLEAEIEREIGVETQITILNDLDAPIFAFQIINGGKILVDKEPEGRILYEASVIRRYHDWHYFLKRHRMNFFTP